MVGYGVHRCGVKRLRCSLGRWSGLEEKSGALDLHLTFRKSYIDFLEKLVDRYCHSQYQILEHAEAEACLPHRQQMSLAWQEFSSNLTLQC